MNEKEYFKLVQEIKNENVIGVDDLENKEDRTLLYGYTIIRDTWHVYLKDGEIITCFYNCDDKYINVLNVATNDYYIPSKRLYPEFCDLEFCKLLKQNGVYLPFTTYNDADYVQKRIEEEKFYGEIIKE